MSNINICSERNTVMPFLSPFSFVLLLVEALLEQLRLLPTLADTIPQAATSLHLCLETDCMTRLLGIATTGLEEHTTYHTSTIRNMCPWFLSFSVFSVIYVNLCKSMHVIPIWFQSLLHNLKNQ